MAYASASDVAAYTPGLLDDGEFTATSRPSRDDVARYLTAGDALIDTTLAGAGYSTPVGAAATVYNFVIDLSALYAAARAETTRLSARVAATERTRAQVLMEEFNNGLDMLVDQDLSRSGLTRAATGKLYAGGISKADKKSVEGDTDRVVPRFERGQFRYSDTQTPGGTTTDTESE